MRSKVEFIDDDLDFVDKTGSATFTHNTGWGVAVSGVMIYNGISGDRQDPYYPAEGDAEKIDTCLLHPAPIGSTLHYHSVSPCVADADFELDTLATEI